MDGDDEDVLGLELDGPLGRRDVRCGLGDRVRGQVGKLDLERELGIRRARADDEHLPQWGGGREDEGEERGDAVDDTERVDLELWTRAKLSLRAELEGKKREELTASMKSASRASISGLCGGNKA